MPWSMAALPGRMAEEERFQLTFREADEHSIKIESGNYTQLVYGTWPISTKLKRAGERKMAIKQ